MSILFNRNLVDIEEVGTLENVCGLVRVTGFQVKVRDISNSKKRHRCTDVRFHCFPDSGTPDSNYGRAVKSPERIALCRLK
jgi:hypothetical protein